MFDLPRLAFVHVPKTAGTSVTDSICRAYGDLTFLGMTTLDYRNVSDEELHSYRFFKGHMYRADYERLPSETLKFMIMREPIDRLVSLYHYYKSIDQSGIDDKYMLEAINLAKTTSIVEFVYSPSPFVIEHVRYGQLRQFLSRSTLEELAHRQFSSNALKSSIVNEFLTEIAKFDFVLTCELLRWSFPLMVRQLRLPKDSARLGHANSSLRPEYSNAQHVARAVMDVTDIEFECYDHVKRKEIEFLDREFAPFVLQTME